MLLEAPCGSPDLPKPKLPRRCRRARPGSPVVEFLRKHGISRQTEYGWRSRYSGAAVAEHTKLLALKADHAKLKRRYADSRWSARRSRMCSAENGNAVREARSRRPAGRRASPLGSAGRPGGATVAGGVLSTCESSDHDADCDTMKSLRSLPARDSVLWPIHRREYTLSPRCDTQRFSQPSSQPLPFQAARRV
jgi:putative transposase